MMDPSSSSSSSGGGGVGDHAAAVSAAAAATARWYQHLLDRATPHVGRRWLGFGAVAAVYALRVWVVSGYYIVTYALGIYVLNLLIAFLSPQVDPEIADVLGEGSGTGGPVLSLPTRASDEFRPFVRRLPEFKFWYSITKAFCLAFVLTLFSVFDVPVFWPILLFYWFVLFTVTMKRQILHMIKYRYVPFSFGKQVYNQKKGHFRRRSLSSQGLKNKESGTARSSQGLKTWESVIAKSSSKCFCYVATGKLIWVALAAFLE